MSGNFVNANQVFRVRKARDNDPYEFVKDRIARSLPNF